MSIAVSYVGRTYPETAPYEVGREKIREFADAIGDPNPAYRDPKAARALGHSDVVAPPTFVVVVTFAASRQVVQDPDLAIDYSRVVHGEQRFSYTRPVQAGDRLVATVTIENIRAVAGNDILTTRADVAGEDGGHVVTVHSTLVVRGEKG